MGDEPGSSPRPRGHHKGPSKTEEGGGRVREGDETADTEVRGVTAGRGDRKGREPREAGAWRSWKWPGNTLRQSPQEEPALPTSP